MQKQVEQMAATRQIVRKAAILIKYTVEEEFTSLLAPCFVEMEVQTDHLE
jgi:hypothetical protein